MFATGLNIQPVVRSDAYFWCALLGLLAARLLVVPAHEMALFYDEAYYHLWSTSPDLGYYSKPPMVAWLISASTAVLGHSEWAVRLPSPLLYFFTSIVVYQIGLLLFNQAVARVSVLLFSTMPLVSFNSLFITTDAPLVFFWALSLWCFIKAVQTRHVGFWVVGGIALGFGMLSKYTMGVFVVSLFIYLVTNQSGRQLLLQPGVWISAVISSMLFCTNLWWNAQHDFISFQHTSEISKLSGSLFHLDKLAEFFFGQWFVFGPVAMWCFFRGCGVLAPRIQKHSVQNAPNDKQFQIDGIGLMFWLAAPMFCIICLQALLAHAYVNWAAPAYVSASLFVAHWLVLKNKHTLVVWGISLNLMLAALFYAYPAVQKVMSIDVSKRNTPYHRVMGWREVVQRIPLAAAVSADTRYLSESRALLSYVHYYLSDFNTNRVAHVTSFNKNQKIDNHFDLLFSLNPKDQGSYMYISETPETLSGCFTQVGDVVPVVYKVSRHVERRVYLHHVKGFLGYEYCAQ